MSLLKLGFLLVFLAVPEFCVSSYVYPLWGLPEERPEDSGDYADGDATVTEFIIANFAVPMRDVFCNVCSNFLEVYTCVLENFETFGAKDRQESPTYFEQILRYLGFENQLLNTPKSCSYYSILVVTITVIVFVSAAIIAKKLVEYVKEEDKVFPQILINYQNKCPCYQEDQ